MSNYNNMGFNLQKINDGYKYWLINVLNNGCINTSLENEQYKNNKKMHFPFVFGKKLL